MALVVLSVAEQRLDAVRAVLGGMDVVEVAARTGVHRSLRRRVQIGILGPRDRKPARPADLQDESYPPEVRRLGPTLVRWRHQIAAWHQADVTERADPSDQQPDQEDPTRIGPSAIAHLATPVSPPSTPPRVKASLLDKNL